MGLHRRKLCYIINYTISTKCKDNIKYTNTLCRITLLWIYYFLRLRSLSRKIDCKFGREMCDPLRLMSCVFYTLLRCEII